MPQSRSGKRRSVSAPSPPSRASAPAAAPAPVEVLGVPISALGLDDAVATVDVWIERGERSYACLVNVHVVETARRSAGLGAALRGSTLNLPDGAPVAWLAGKIGRTPVPRVTGYDLFEALCSSAPRRHFFLGSTEQTLERLAEAVGRRYPAAEICGLHAPPFGPFGERDSAEMVERVNDARPDIVWVGLGAPRQELWMHANRGRLVAPALIGVGAVFDFASGGKARAPQWAQRAGLEWAHRLGSEPRRLWRRYLVTNTSFVVRAGAELTARQVRSIGRGT